MKTIMNLLFLIFISLFVAACGGGGGNDDNGDDETDNESPNTSISSAPVSLTNSTSATFVFASTESGSTFECSLDSGAFTSCASPADFTGLAEGSHSLSVVATDAAGNTDPTPATHDWEIDLTPPDTSITSTPGNPTNLTSANFVFTSSEAGSTFQCTLDGVQANCTTPLNFTGLGLGDHSFSVEATDAAGNTDLSPATYSWVININADVTPPTVTAPANITVEAESGAGTPASNAAIVAFLAASSAVDAVDPSPAFSHNAPTTFPLGATVVTFTYTDFSGNAGNGTATVTVVDTTPTTVTAPANITVEAESGVGTPASNAAIVAFLAASNAVDAVDPSPAFSHNAPTTFPLGATVVTFTYTDFSGNAGNDTATVTVVDTTPPTVTAPANITVEAESGAGTPASNAAIVAFLAASSAVDAVDPSPAFSHNAPTTFPLGATVVTFTYTDFSGNAGNDTATVTVVDTTPPTVTAPANITVEAESGAGTPASNAAIVAFLAASSAVDSVDPSPAFSHNAPTTFPLGATVVTFTYTDFSGNAGNDTATVTVVDTTPPSVTAPANIPVGTTNPAGEPATNATIATFLAGASCVDTVDSSPVITDNAPSTFPVGDTIVTFTCTDFSGNEDTDTATVTVLFDNIAPDTTSIVINNNAQYAVSISEFTARLIASDNVGVTDYLVTEHNTTDSFNIVPPYLDPLPSDPNWVPVTETPNLDTTIQFPLTGNHSLGDTVELCVWFMDERANISDRVCDSITYGNTWESGIGNWFADNGVWQVGTPTLVGPASCFSGTQCAGTVLNGNYPVGTDSRLIGTTLQLPTVVGLEEIHLRFQNWFSYTTGDSGQVQISVWDAATSTWGSWLSEGDVLVSHSDWTVKDVDLTAYSGETVRIGFMHTESSVSVSTGWYIDDIEIVTKVPAFTGDFETGWADWGAGRGVWQIGTPAAGPGACFTGSQCAGTILDGNYPVGTDSRLISATLQLPTVVGLEEIHLRFQNWFSYTTGDSGQVQISVWDAATSTWGSWLSEGDVLVSHSDWTVKDVDLTAYSGETVRIGFMHTESSVSVSTGWYIDDIEIVTKVPAFTGDFETGWADWGAGRGVWQIGTPAAGPGACFTGSQCAGTILDGNYPVGTDSRLISATMQLPTVVGLEEIHLRFQNWFSYTTGDSGQVQISVWDAATSTWGSWLSEGDVLVSHSDWTVKDVDLTAYSGETVRIGFMHTESSVSVSTGWYIDDIEIVTKVPAFTGDFETGWADWGAGRGVWQIGTPAAGPGACFTGSQCAGTILDGNYPVGTDSRLISATMQLPTVVGLEEIHLRFQNWFSYTTGDSGQVQISVWDAATSTWGSWLSEGDVLVSHSDWTVKDVDLTAYSGETVRIGFMHTESSVSVSTGWYIDDIEIVTKVPAFTGDFETGWADWGAGRGVWQIGTPAAGPGACFTGSQCAGTILDGNYPVGTDSRLISATMQLPTVSGFEEIHLRFQNWFSYTTGDSGQVQIQVWDDVTSTWGSWVSEGTPVSASSGGWSLKDVLLTSYSGEIVRIGFLHTETSVSVSTGWYIDDITISVF